MRTIHDYKQLLGSELCSADRLKVLALFVHRHTAEHKPAWARCEWRNGKEYPVQFASDAEWLANTRFAVNRHGRLIEAVSECLSTPTWPENPELRLKAIA